MLERLILCFGFVATLGFNIFISITLSNNTDYYNVCEPYIYNCLLYILISSYVLMFLIICKYICECAISYEPLSSIEIVSNDTNNTNDTNNDLTLNIYNKCQKFILHTIIIIAGIWVFICYYTADRECYSGSNLWEILTVYLVFSYIYFCCLIIIVIPYDILNILYIIMSCLSLLFTK